MTYERKQVLTVKNGETAELLLDDEIPSSGYLWLVEDKGGVDVQRKSFTPGGQMGGSVTAAFNAKAPGPGSYCIEFVHKRPWEDTVHSRVRYVLNVV